MADIKKPQHYSSSNTNCSSDNPGIPFETFLKNKRRGLHEGQINFGSYWTKSQSFQANSDQTLTHPQHAGKLLLRPAQGYYNMNSECVSTLGPKKTIWWNNSLRSIQRLVEQTLSHGNTTGFSGNNDTCQKLTHCFLNKRPPEAPSMSEISHQQSLPKVSLQQKIPIDHKHSGASFPVSNPLPCFSSQVCSENFKQQTTMNNQSEVDHVNRMCMNPYEKTKPFFLMNGSSTGFVAGNVIVEDQTVRQPYYNDACMPKTSRHEKHVQQKAVAVVTPLAQQVVSGTGLSKNLIKLIEGGPETKSVANKQDYRSCVLHSIQTNDCGSKVPCSKTDRVHVSQEMPSKSVIASGFSETIDTVNVAASELNSQRERLCSAMLGCVNGGIKESAQSSQMEDHSSSDFHQQNVTIANRIYEGIETLMDIESTDKSSSIPITEWSLQRLLTLVADLEQMQKKNYKYNPIIDLGSEIVKLYWNGDYQNLCDAARSGHYLNIMKQVSLHSGTENSVIFKEISKEKLDQADEDCNILISDPAPPKMVSKMVHGSCCFNLNDILCTDTQNGCLSSLRAVCSRPKIADDVTVEEQKVIEETEIDQPDTDNASLDAVVFPQARSTRLPTVPSKHFSAMEAKALVKESVCIDVEDKGTNKDGEVLKQKKSTLECLSKQSVITVNICKNAMELTETEGENKKVHFTKETLEQPLMVSINKPLLTMTIDRSRNVMLKRAKLEAAHGKTEGINLEENPSTEGPLPLSLSKQSQAMSVEPKGPCATVLTPQSDSCDGTCTDPFAFVQIKILSPERAKRFFSGESDEVEYKGKDISAQPFTENHDQVIVKYLDGISLHKEHVDTKKKPTERNNTSHATEQVNNYCCLSKWFQVLGYENIEHCVCEKKAELNPGAETSGQGVSETNESTTVKTCESSPPLDHTSMDELELVDEDVHKVACVMPEQCIDNSLAQCEKTKKRKLSAPMHTYQKRKTHHNGYNRLDFKSNCSPVNCDYSQIDLCKKNTFVAVTSTDDSIPHEKNETTNPESETKGKIIHLSLYGSSHLNQNKTTRNSYVKKKMCGIRSSDNVHLPAESINVMVGFDCSDDSNSRSPITKGHILNSCMTSQVPSEMDGADFSVTKLDTSTAFEITGTFLSRKEDIQTHGSESTKKRFSFTSVDQQKNPDKQSKDKLHSTSWTKLRKGKKKERKSVRSSFETPCTFGEGTPTSDKGLLLDFKVLPESFKLIHDINVTAADQSADTNSGPKDKTQGQEKKMCGNPGAWCVSPWKKMHFKSTKTSDMSGPCSVFKEFKMRYEQKRQRMI